MDKKAQINQQFNWIFAIMAGAVIIMFFIFVIGQIKMSSEAKLSAKVLNNFDAILSGSSASPRTLAKMETTSMLKFSVSCEEDGFSEISLEKGSSRVSTAKKPIYSPGKIDAEILYIYTQPIEKPFYSSNALLISDSKTMFVFFGKDEVSSSFAESVHDFFPDNITKEYTGFFKDKYKNYNKLVVISSNEVPSLNENTETYHEQDVLKKLNVNWLQINTDLEKIYFYKKGNKDKVFKNAGTINNITSNELVMLAAFSKDPIFYECNLNKINDKISVISKIYKERARKLEAKESSCSLQYGDAFDLFKKLEKSEQPLFEKNTIKRLKDINEALLMNSCPLIY